MNLRVTLDDQPSALSVRVPIRLKKQGGRKQVLLPDLPPEDLTPRVDAPLVRALARAYRWKREFETGDYANLTDLAKSEGLTLPYFSRIYRLNLLAPDIVEAILDGRQPDSLTFKALMKRFPVEWARQRRR